ncbi:MAG TPA: hypothetical protein VE466_11045 [Acidimicrobiales bacterium]|nr:hypothetical protein [Acidimicrobiales bacterium]
MRDFTPGDQTAVRELVLGGMRERWGDAYDPSANPDLDDISASYINWGAEVVVVDIEGEIVATAHCCRNAIAVGGSSLCPSTGPTAGRGSADRSSRSWFGVLVGGACSRSSC